MITSGFTYLAVLVFLAGCISLLEKTSRFKFFDYVPAIVLLYFVVLLLSALGMWEKSDSVNMTYHSVKTNLLPAMIFLMLLKSDLRNIAKLGPRMIGGFFAATFSIAFGFIVAFAIFGQWLAPTAWKTFAALSGSWMGGAGNMAAIQVALDISDSQMGYTLLIDSIDYALWVMMLLALVPYAGHFNRWVKADTSVLERLGASLEPDKVEPQRHIRSSDILFLLGSALLASAVVQLLASSLPVTAFMSTMTWTVLIVTGCGVVAALTPMGKLPGSSEISQVMLYLIVALIASRANFTELGEAPIYVLAGLVILLVHAVTLVAIAKLFRLDLFTCGLASLANIGGVASAPILAAAYSEVLVPIGILMAMLGYIVGTGGGLLVGKILSMMV